MNFGMVIGSVWATRKDESLEGEFLKVIQPITASKEKQGMPLIACDSIGAGNGEIILFTTSTEAAIPLKYRKNRAMVATDATIVGIVDRIDTVSVSIS
ncbi:MAG: EutN/CcmL family microcompartment protein [Chloroherpetonaceae bacterium]|nr:EutN/CcmL family microcompartment protein [Chloroherpetonaceae bacterium]